jgi:hypothetical protein
VEVGRRRLHNEELHNLYASPHIIRVIEPRRMILAGYVARTGKMRSVYNILAEKSEETKLFGRPRYTRRLILK